ncbi:MAG: glycosyltransferase family 1 protein [Alphaproteobacteria bacterium]|nr:glycosyltransferase family 1 protein [Alphaproteobacteria bacterium]
MKILIVSDAATPQVNGVVRTIDALVFELEKAGHTVKKETPDPTRFWTRRIPFYPEIKFEFFAARRLAASIHAFEPDRIHIATEGPLGWAARRACLKEGRPFTTAYHTNFPSYLAVRAPRVLAALVEKIGYAILRRFHAPSSAVMVPTQAIEETLRAHQFKRLVRWTRGVDTTVFKPYGKNFPAYKGLKRPIALNVGRVVTEKNLPAFLSLRTEGHKVVIGDGPARKALQKAYPDVVFLGTLHGEALARAMAAADVFVFPSKTDTFGLVLLEAAAAGLRIAAYPTTGPRDVLGAPQANAFAVLDDDLQKALTDALALPDNPNAAHAYAKKFSWSASAKQFETHLQAPAPKATRRLSWLRALLGEGLFKR